MLQELVFIESEDLNCEPFTTDEIIAKVVGIKRSSIQRLIRKHYTRLETFGEVSYQNIKIKTGKRGGQYKKVYFLNIDQALQVIDWTRNLNRNNQQAAKLKDELIASKDGLVSNNTQNART